MSGQIYGSGDIYGPHVNETRPSTQILAEVVTNQNDSPHTTNGRLSTQGNWVWLENLREPNCVKQ